MGSSFELATTETSARKALTSAAAGVSLSKQTMHRAHDPRGSGPSGERAYLGQEPFRCKYAQRFLYAPFAVGAALIWGSVLGVKR